MSLSYHLKHGIEESGPYSLDQLRKMEQTGELRLGDFLRADGSNEWKPANHFPGLFGRAMPMSTNAKVLVGAGAGCGLLLFGVCMLAMLMFLLSDSTSPDQTTQSPTQFITEFSQARLNEEKQRIFDALYPVGTAKNVIVHEVTIDAWKSGSQRRHANDVRQFTVRFTLYWQSPLVPDGFTKISQVQDVESGRALRTDILATNANFTNRDVGEALLFLGGELLFGN